MSTDNEQDDDSLEYDEEYDEEYEGGDCEDMGCPGTRDHCPTCDACPNKDCAHIFLNSGPDWILEYGLLSCQLYYRIQDSDGNDPIDVLRSELIGLEADVRPWAETIGYEPIEKVISSLDVVDGFYWEDLFSAEQQRPVLENMSGATVMLSEFLYNCRADYDSVEYETVGMSADRVEVYRSPDPQACGTSICEAAMEYTKEVREIREIVAKWPKEWEEVLKLQSVN